MAAYDGTIRIDSRLNTSGFNNGIKSMTGSLKGLALAVGAAFSTAAVVVFGKSAVSAASELASAMTGLKSVLDGTGKSFTEGQKFINDYIKDGLVPATNAINAYKNLAIRGYSTEQIERTLIALKDAAAFSRQSSLTMGEAIQGASEGLKNENSLLVDNSGVTKNVSVMWKEYADQIGTTVGMLTKQQKIQAEVNGILSETRFQTGDAAKASNSYAGQVAALGTSFYNLKVAIGNAIIPILSAIIPVIKSAVDWLVIMVNQFAQLIGILFGIKLGIDGVTKSAQNATDATNNQADATNKAKKAAQGALAAFDELNVLQSKGTEEGQPGEAPKIKVPPLDTEPVETGLEGLKERLEKFKAAVADLFAPAVASLGKLREALAPFAGNVAEGLLWLWDNVLVPLGRWVVSKALPSFLEFLAGAITVLNSIINALKPGATWLWEKFLKPAAAWVGDKIIEALGWLTDQLYKLSDWITKHQKTVETIAIVLGIFAAAWLAVTAAMAIYNVVMGIAAVVTNLTIAPIWLIVLAIAAVIAIIVILYRHWDDIKRIALDVWEKVKEGWGNAADWFNEHVIQPLADWFSGAWEDIKGFFGDAWTWIKNAWKDAKDWFSDKVIDPIKEFFDNAWEDIKDFPGDAWDAIKKAWEGAKTWFTDNVIDPIKEGFETALESIQTAFETVFQGVKDFIKARINDIIAFVNAMISAIASGINSVINALNSIHVKIPDWVPLVGGNEFGISIPNVVPPSIPYLAQGGVIPPNAEFLAVLGDQKSGRNIETPEALMRQVVREEIGNVQADIRIEFGGISAQLVRMLQPEITRERTRVGGSLIASGATAR